MTRKITLNSKITFTNPYVIKIRHSIIENDVLSLPKFFTTLQRAKKIYTGTTWGYSNPEMGPSSNKTTVVIHNGNQMQIPWIDYDLCSYWVFKDEQDALQMRLTIGEYAQKVIIWPSSIKFTIYEYSN